MDWAVETSIYMEFAANMPATDEFGDLPDVITFVRWAHGMPRKYWDIISP